MITKEQLESLRLYLVKFAKITNEIASSGGTNLGQDISIVNGIADQDNFYLQFSRGKIKINRINPDKIEYSESSVQKEIDEESYPIIISALGTAAAELRKFGFEIDDYLESAALAPVASREIEVKISYPEFSSVLFNAMPIAVKKQVIEQDFKDALTGLTILSSLNSNEALAIADLMMIIELIENQNGLFPSENLRNLNFSAMAPQISYMEGGHNSVIVLSESLKCNNPPRDVSTFGQIYEARMKDLALMLQRLITQDLPSEDARALIESNTAFTKLCKKVAQIKTETLRIDEQEYNKVAPSSFLMYRAVNGELCLKFSSKEARDKALTNFKLCAISDDFCKGPQFGPNQNSYGIMPCTFRGCEDSIFFPTYRAQNGEIAVNLGSQHNRDSFSALLKLTKNNTAKCEQYNGPDGKIYSRYDNMSQKNTLYFEAKEIMNADSRGSYRFYPNEDGSVTCVGFIERPEILTAGLASGGAVFAGRRGAAAMASESPVPADREEKRGIILSQECDPKINALMQLVELNLAERTIPSAAVQVSAAAAPLSVAFSDAKSY